ANFYNVKDAAGGVKSRSRGRWRPSVRGGLPHPLEYLIATEGFHRFERAGLQSGLVALVIPAPGPDHEIIGIGRERIIIDGPVLVQVFPADQFHVGLVRRKMIAALEKKEQLALVGLDHRRGRRGRVQIIDGFEEGSVGLDDEALVEIRNRMAEGPDAE